MKLKYKVFAKNTTYYSMEVEATSEEEANKIADESDGADWQVDCHGDWIVEYELTDPLPLDGMCGCGRYEEKAGAK